MCSTKVLYNSFIKIVPVIRNVNCVVNGEIRVKKWTVLRNFCRPMLINVRANNFIFRAGYVQWNINNFFDKFPKFDGAWWMMMHRLVCKSNAHSHWKKTNKSCFYAALKLLILIFHRLFMSNLLHGNWNWCSNRKQHILQTL